MDVSHIKHYNQKMRMSLIFVQKGEVVVCTFTSWSDLPNAAVLNAAVCCCMKVIAKFACLAVLEILTMFYLNSL